VKGGINFGKSKVAGSRGRKKARGGKKVTAAGGTECLSLERSGTGQATEKKKNSGEGGRGGRGRGDA